MSGETRIGDAEREQASAALGDHYAAGRLDHVEYSERLDAIWTARTRGDLDVLFHDLPRLAPPQPPLRRGRGSLPFPVIALLVLVVGALVITRLPVLLFVIAIVLLIKIGHRPGHPAGRRWHGTSRR